MFAYHQSAVFAAMRDPATYPHPVDAITVQDTHISRVFLTGRWVYKIKKAVNFGFLDFSTLAQRRHYCHREVELNRRLTRGVYADVVAINFRNGIYQLAGHGPIVEYAVCMRQLADNDRLRDRLHRGAVDADRITSLVKYLLAFDARTPRVAPRYKYDCWLAVRAACRQNFRRVGSPPLIFRNRRRLEQIRSVSEAFLTAHKTRFLHRVEQGHVRDGHGDLRSDHIYLGHDGAIQIIDCIEFSDQLRQIDIVSDLAFLTMDLDHNACPQYADLVMQTYAKARNDPTGLMLWPFYQCYRAMVRCKVNAIHFQQANGDRHREAIHREAARQYLQQAADDAARMSTPVLIAMCGLPGAGKSTLARALARVQAIPVYRADVERIKRFGRSAGEGGVPATRRGRYSTPARNQVYHDLRKHARIALEEGRSVILDATFSRSIHRRAVRRLAANCGADMAIVMCRASAASTQTRLRQRETSPGLSDARRVHLPAIQKQFEPPAPGSDVIEIDTDGSIESALAEVLIRITRRPPPNLRPGALSALKGGHHVQNHLSGHGPGDRTRHDRYGGSDAERPLPV